MKSCRFSSRRIGAINSSTMAKPDNNAPNTKNGGNWVECHPVVAAPAKSNPTTLCTETTSGAMIAASTPYVA